MAGLGRRGGSRNLARSLFAGFWILLGGASGLYLFTLLTDPEALRGQAAATSNAPSEAAAPAPAAETPAITTDQASALIEADQTHNAALNEIKTALRALSGQLSDLDTRLQPIEKFVGPVAALPGSTSVTTSPPSPDPLPPETQAVTPAPVAPPAEAAPAEAPPAPEAAAEPEPAPEPAPVAPPPPDRVERPAPAPAAEVAPEPTPEPEPEQAAAEPEPAPVEEPAPVGVAEAEPGEPPVIEDVAGAPAPPTSEPATEPAPEPAPVASEAPAPPAEGMETAALDPVMLPPTANDGTTRFGIEIGTVDKREGLRPLWREYLTNHAALVAGLQPRRVLAPDKKWRLIAGPFANAEEAAAACALFKKAERPCAATVYAGDSL